MDETWHSDTARGAAGLAVMSPNEMGQYEFSYKAMCTEREHNSRKGCLQTTYNWVTKLMTAKTIFLYKI